MVDLKNREHILYSDSSFVVTEAIKAVRTNLIFTVAKEEKPIISITSAYMGEGKSTVCANVALAFAESGFKTLIIDADMRKPTINKFFKIRSSPGLSDLLGGITKESTILNTSYKNLYILPSGTIPPNPSELLTSERMSLLLGELREKFDYIFIDTPPVLIVTDAITLANKVTGTVIAVKQNYSRTNDVKEAVDLFRNIDLEILGFVFNNYNMETKSRRGRYGSYGHAYEYTSETKKRDT